MQLKPTLKKLPGILFMLLTINAVSQELNESEEIEYTLSLLNDIRRNANLDTVALSATLSEACNKHARYLVINKGNPKLNGLGAHKEFPELQGYSKEGETAAKNSDIHYIKPSEAIGDWLRGFYHRVPMLQPTLKEVGIGFYQQNGQVVSLLDCGTAKKGESDIDIVYYPSEDQEEVPLSLGREIPNPAGSEGDFGFPIVIYFAKWQKVTNVKFSLKDNDGNVVNCLVSWPEKPATSFDQWNSICAISKNRLAANTQYTVKVSCNVNGEAFEKEYSFQTADE